MKKYMCNGCGKLHDFHIDAAICHPDVVEVDDENLPERAAQLLRAPAEPEQTCPSCNGLGIARDIDSIFRACDACNGTGKSNRSGRG